MLEESEPVVHVWSFALLYHGCCPLFFFMSFEFRVVLRKPQRQFLLAPDAEYHSHEQCLHQCVPGVDGVERPGHVLPEFLRDFAGSRNGISSVTQQPPTMCRRSRTRVDIPAR